MLDIAWLEASVSNLKLQEAQLERDLERVRGALLFCDAALVKAREVPTEEPDPVEEPPFDPPVAEV